MNLVEVLIIVATTDGIYSMLLDKGGVLNGQVDHLDIGPMDVVTTLVETEGPESNNYW